MSKTRVQQARERMGLSQRDFVAAAGVSRQPLRGWENRTNIPSAAYALKVAEFAGLDIDDLVADLVLQRVPREDGPKVIHEGATVT